MLAGWGLNTRRGSVALTGVTSAAVAAAYALFAFGSGATATAVPASAQRASTATGTTISTRSTAIGLIVVGSSHRTVYMFTRDGTKVSHCGTTCRKTWPPVKTSGTPRAGSGISQKHLSQTAGHQATYYGHPLYYYSGDHATAGRTRGQGLSSFNGHWWVLSPQGQPGTGAKITIHSTPDGNAVAGPLGNGRTLYSLTTDSSTHSTCTGSNGCTGTWPPLITTGAPRAGSGTTKSLVSTLVRSNGARQVTYNGHPLYYYAGDSHAGQDYGECQPQVPGTWYFLNAAGHFVKNGASADCSTTSGTTTPPTTGPPPVTCAPHPGDGVINTATVGTAGTILVDSVGCTVYEYQGDTQNGTTSACLNTGTAPVCTSHWPPVMTSGTPSGSGCTGLLGTITRTAPSGTQVTCNGYPLYYYYGDNNPGTDHGQNLLAYGHYWYVLSSTGTRVCPMNNCRP
jgi:predicted lipoprotein with Yx(FWY)xxD motif